MYLREMHICYGPSRRRDGDERPFVRTTHDAVRLLEPLLESETVEVALMLCLNIRLEALCFHRVSRGALDHTSIHPREVFKAALLANAAAVILSHNHPSGNATPSPADLSLVKNLDAAGRLLQVPVVDHIIIGHQRRYWSSKEAGLTAPWPEPWSL